MKLLTLSCRVDPSNLPGNAYNRSRRKYDSSCVRAKILHASALCRSWCALTARSPTRIVIGFMFSSLAQQRIGPPASIGSLPSCYADELNSIMEGVAGSREVALHNSYQELRLDDDTFILVARNSYYSVCRRLIILKIAPADVESGELLI